MISIIIPVLNEASTIAHSIYHLNKNTNKSELVEVIVVDGGSDDNTLVLAKAELDKTPFSHKVITSPRGRAVQMNTGASVAQGDILYFLHVDSWPPNKYDESIRKAVIQGNTAGCFRLRFDMKHWWLWLAGRLTHINHKSARGGDQSQYIETSLFETIGGFNEDYEVCEDVELINELYRRKQFYIIPDTIVTSARLYQKHGVWKLQYHFYMIYIKKKMGASPEALAAYYKLHLG